MTTAIHALTNATLNGREKNSLKTLQKKVESTPAMFTRVSLAQTAAMQKAWTAAKASGLHIDPEMIEAAKQLGLK